MTRYRKKPIEIEAVQFTGEIDDEIANFLKGQKVDVGLHTTLSDEGKVLGSEKYIILKTLEGEMKVIKGDWIIKGVKGEFYPCKPDIFDETYEEVKE
jgi:hypothetical protein